MWITAAAATALIGTVLALILGQYRSEFRMFVAIGVSLLLMGIVLTQIAPVLDEIQNVVELTGMSGDYAAVLFKGVGICLLTQLAGDVCKDSGENSIAAKVELIGRTAILLLTLPMIRDVLGWAWEIINL